MAIFLKNSWNVPPRRWGSPADIRYAVKVNAEKTYKVDPYSIVRALPLFWGFPCIDYSLYYRQIINQGALYTDNLIRTVASDSTYIDCGLFTAKPEFTLIYSCRDISSASPVNRVSKYKHVHEEEGWEDWIVGIGVDKKITFTTWAGGYETLKSVNTVGAEALIRIAVNFDIANTKRIYLNGTFENSSVISSDIDIHTEKIIIGAHGLFMSPPVFFDSNLYEFNFSNVARTAEQIKLFGALPYGLYQKVPRPFYLLPIIPTGWTGKINTVTNPSKIMGVATTGLSKVMGG